MGTFCLNCTDFINDVSFMLANILFLILFVAYGILQGMIEI